MNNKFISLATAAALLSLGFSACNKVDVQSPDVNPSEMTTAYAKVAIYMPKGTSTRSDVTASEADEKFAAGTEEESIVKDIQLALYDDFDNYVGIGKLVSQMTEKPTQDGKDNVSDTYEKVFRLTLSDGANKPTKVVAFINMDANTSNLNDLLTNGKVTESVYKTTDGFIMTNSGYYNDKGEYVVAAAIPGDAIYHDETEPSSTTVPIYVERMAAKITVNSVNPDQNNLNYVVNDVADKEVKLEYTPKYWGATGTAQKENLVKTAFENKTSSWMNDAGSHRSYWANGVNWGLKIDEYSTASGPLTYLNFGAIKGVGEAESENAPANMNAIGKSNYVLEHTSPLGIDKMNLIANTYAIVTGNYAVKQDESEHAWFKADEDGNVDFYLLLAGEKDGKKVYTIYTESQLIAYLLKWNGVEKIYTDGTAGEALLVTDNEAKFAEYLTLGYDFENNQYKLAAGDSPVYVDGEAGGREELDVTKLTKSTNSRHYCFPKGGAYFNVPIATNTTATVNTYGVVRNHSYVLNITEIQNLGAPLDENEFKEDPGDNPDPKPVVPDPDDFQDNFIKAKINVLSWHVIDNGVTL